MPKECQNDEYSLHAQGQSNILPDDRKRATRMAHEPWDLRKIVGHQRYIRCFHCGVATRRAHRDRQRRPAHGRSIVDAVTDHRDMSILADQSFDDVDFVGWEQLWTNLLNSGFVRDGFGGTSIVSGKHDDVLDSRIPKFLHDRARLWTDGIRQGDEPADVFIISHNDDGPAGARQIFELLVDLRRFLTALLQISM